MSSIELNNQISESKEQQEELKSTSEEMIKEYSEGVLTDEDANAASGGLQAGPLRTGQVLL